jgi:hypothetical protein
VIYSGDPNLDFVRYGIKVLGQKIARSERWLQDLKRNLRDLEIEEKQILEAKERRNQSGGATEQA